MTDPANYAHLAKMHVVDGRLEVDPTAYLRLAYWVAGRFVNKHSEWQFDLDEFQDEAIFGLLKAVRNFVPERGRKFTTFASHVIYRWLNDWATKLTATRATLSIDYDAGRGPVGDLLPDREEELADPDDREELRKRLEKLDPRSRFVVKARCDGKTMRQTAEHLGCSHQTVGNIERKARQKMGATGTPCGKTFRSTLRRDRIMSVLRSLSPECRYADALPALRLLNCVVLEPSFRRYMDIAFPERQKHRRKNWTPTLKTPG